MTSCVCFTESLRCRRSSPSGSLSVCLCLCPWADTLVCMRVCVCVCVCVCAAAWLYSLSVLSLLFSRESFLLCVLSVSEAAVPLSFVFSLSFCRTNQTRASNENRHEVLWTEAWPVLYSVESLPLWRSLGSLPNVGSGVASSISRRPCALCALPSWHTPSLWSPAQALFMNCCCTTPLTNPAPLHKHAHTLSILNEPAHTLRGTAASSRVSVLSIVCACIHPCKRIQTSTPHPWRTQS